MEGTPICDTLGLIYQPYRNVTTTDLYVCDSFYYVNPSGEPGRILADLNGDGLIEQVAPELLGLGARNILGTTEDPNTEVTDPVVPWTETRSLGLTFEVFFCLMLALLDESSNVIGRNSNCSF